MVGEKWRQMSEEERERILSQCAADGGHCIITGFGVAVARGMGPFKTEAEFNIFLRRARRIWGREGCGEVISRRCSRMVC